MKGAGLHWNDLKIKTQMTVAAIAIISLATAVICAITVIAIKKRGRADIEQYKAGQLATIKNELKSFVDIAYATIDSNYKNATRKNYLERHYGLRLKNVIDIAEAVLKEKASFAKEGRITVEEAQKLAKDELKKIRYDSGAGYIWINDLRFPGTRILMHPIDPSLEKNVNWKDKKWYCAEGKGRNLFEAFIDTCRKHGGGFVEYVWDKPSGNNLMHNVPKLSYVRLFKEWGWIIGTGIYTDDAMRDATAKSLADLKTMRYDNGTGYFWINDTARPYPRMIMHPIMPWLDGKIMDDPKFRCAEGKRKNIFQSFLDVCDGPGEGYVGYTWPKPGTNGPAVDRPKLSFVKAYRPLGWIIGTGVYTDRIDEEIARRTEAMNAQINELVTKIILISFLVMCASVLFILLSSKTITDPIWNLIRAMKVVGAEGLDSTKVSLSGAAEIRELGGIFNGMLDAVRDAVRKLTETTAAKERIEGELSAAREIQMGILPKIFPPFPDRGEFDIHAVIEPAKEVGGDFYDFFFIDKDKFCFVIGDVSGKGVPASLFMAITKTLHKAAAVPEATPATILTKVNSELSQNNENSMFVTMFCSILNTSTGEVIYANGGHNPPLLSSPKIGRAHYLQAEPGVVVGAFDDLCYRDGKLFLDPGDVFFLYTDGVTEAMNTEKQFFSSGRLESLLSSLCGKSIQKIIATVMEEVISFSGNASQSDDITMLAVEFRGPDGNTRV